MNEESTILVPVDFSSFSRAAIERARVIALASHSKLRLLHVLHLPPVALDYNDFGADWSALRAAETERLEQLRQDFSGRGVAVATSFEEGDPVRTILTAARAPDVELIVMGSHGLRGIDRLLLGSVAERTLQNARVPVVIVREDETRAGQEIRSILFATDFSETARRAEEEVTRLAYQMGAEVEIFHVLFETTVLFAPYAVPDSRVFDEELAVAAKRRIEGVLSRFRNAGVQAKAEVVCGFASERILERAEASGSQLIAMGTRGHSGVRRFRLGSVVQRVLRHAPCSVLVAGVESA